VSKAGDLLHAYLCAADEDSEQALTRLCTEILLPVCRRIVRCRLRRHDEDAQDVRYGDTFQKTKSAAVRHYECVQSIPDGTTATVTCLERLMFHLRDGPSLVTHRRTTFQLRRAGEQWVIEDIQATPVRK
jgi:hypothetical protein